MRKHWFRSIGLGGLSAMGLVLGLQQAASAADKKIEIVRKAGRFVFAEPNVTINVGQSVEWWGTDSAPHQLDGNPPFKPTPEFTPPGTATETFDTAGVIKYHCTIHGSMQGTITVLK